MLVDCGIAVDAYAERGLNQQAIQSLDEGLAGLGLRPEDIGIVILTHLHWDHVGLAHRFPRAKFVVQKAELDYALNPHQACAELFDKRMFADLNFEVIEGDREIIDGVRVISTPGHTPGGQSVAVNVKGGTAIITGLCCIQENFEPPPDMKAKGFEVLVPGIHIDIEQAYDSMLKIKRMADIIVPAHEVTLKNKGRIP
jgi:glyoxylase-like metal-dependent hydrolase (beta-lactamase superfamily II)